MKRLIVILMFICFLFVSFLIATALKPVMTENKLPKEAKLIYYDEEKGLYLVAQGEKKFILPSFKDEPEAWFSMMKIWWNEDGDKIRMILNRWDRVANHYTLWEIDEDGKNLRLIEDNYNYKVPDDLSEFETNYLRNPRTFKVDKYDIYRIENGKRKKIVDFLGDECYMNGGFGGLKIARSRKYFLARKNGTEMPWFSGNDILALMFHRSILCIFDTEGTLLFEVEGHISCFDFYEPIK